MFSFYILIFIYLFYNINVTNATTGIYLYRGVIPFDEPGGNTGISGLHDGQIQDRCLRYKRKIRNVECKAYISYNSFRLTKLKDVPYLYQFDPLEPVYGIRDYDNSNEYNQDSRLTLSNETYEIMLDKEHLIYNNVYLGTWDKVVNQQKLQVSLSEAGVLPMGSKFWSVNGCKNWSKGNKQTFGKVGFADYSINYMNIMQARCDQEYYWLCLCIT
jgi:hypothetical protein